MLIAYQKMRAQQIANAEASESSDADEDGDLVDNLYHLQSFGMGENDESHAANLLKHFQSHDEITKEEEEKLASEKEVEKLEAELDDVDQANDVTKTYKLFNYICSQEPGQMIRYVPPPADGVKQMSKYGSVEPLWASQKTRMAPDQVPVCPYCQKPRCFEMQIMP